MFEYYLIKYKTENQDIPDTSEKQTVFGKFIRDLCWNIIKFIIPSGHPDFEEEMGNVEYWYVEFGDKIPEREIGFDINNKVIVITPYKNNFGFWNDSNMELDNFKDKTTFQIEKITQDEFNKKWESFKYEK